MSQFEEYNFNRVGQKWSEEEDKQLLRLYEEGHSLPYICKEHQRFPNGIIQRLIKTHSLFDFPEQCRGYDSDEFKQLMQIVKDRKSQQKQNPTSDSPVETEVLHKLMFDYNYELIKTFIESDNDDFSILNGCDKSMIIKCRKLWKLTMNLKANQ